VVVRAAGHLYRRHLLRVAVTALLVFAPLDVLEKVGESVANELESQSVVLGSLLDAAAVAVIGLSLLAEIFYAGLLDYTVGATLDAEPPPSIRSIFLRLPYWRLIGTELLAVLVIVVGFLLLVVPGLVALTLFSIAGPVVILEDKGPITALKRSAGLLRPRWRLAAAVVFLPVLGFGVLESAAGALVGESLTTTLVVDVALEVTLAAFAGLMIAVLGHLLVRLEQAQRPAAR
jgi:hypothetical protein